MLKVRYLRDAGRDRMQELKEGMNSREVSEGGMLLGVTTLWACSGLWNEYVGPDLDIGNKRGM